MCTVVILFNIEFFFISVGFNWLFYNIVPMSLLSFLDLTNYDPIGNTLSSFHGFSKAILTHVH